MAKATPETTPPIDLKDRALAAFLAWLMPGAGHLYQGRRAKAALFFVCIFGTFAYGMFLGGGRVVYAQWEPAKFRRYPYLCQIGVGLPSLPALVAARRGSFLGMEGRYYVPPETPGPGQRDGGPMSELDQLHFTYNRRFELGTVFTMIAGLLNVLAIYDAWGGPAIVGEPEQAAKKEDPPAPKEDKKEDKAKGAGDSS